MKTGFAFSLLAAACACAAFGTEVVTSPDGRLAVAVDDEGGSPAYTVTLGGETVLARSPLGLVTDFGDFSRGLTLAGATRRAVEETYDLATIKRRSVAVKASRLTVDFTNATGRLSVTFHVSDHDLAFRYTLPRQKGRGAVRVLREATGFSFPEGTTGFLTPQAVPMTGWKRTKPSYEEDYVLDRPLPVARANGNGWTFPALFRTGERWVLLGETGTDGSYCGCRLDEFDGRTTRIAFPLPEENNGSGSVEPAFALPGSTPWRTITVGGLKEIVETTVAWDVVAPKYPARPCDYGRNTWSWIVWQDESINWDDQVAYIDFAAAMGWEGVLVDAFWDRNIGYPKMEKLIAYAASKGVGVWLWYSSSGWWNDIEQSPVNVMSDPIRRKQDMRWMQRLGVKGVKVDFWGGDKQETMRLYEQVLSDADDHGLMVIFHGCTIPRGWERMYPNYVGSEAVLASENRYFSPHFCAVAGVNAALHPFIRNSLGAMEYGGTFLNERMSRDNRSRHARGTTVAFELATAVLFQNPVQNFALTPNNLTDAPAAAIDFMKAVPTTWDETRFLAGYPGRSVALARRKGGRWYLAAVAAEKTVLTLDLSFCGRGVRTVTLDANDGWVDVVGR